MPILDRRTKQFVEDKDTRVSVGLDFPITRVPNQDGYFKTTKSTVESIKNNIKLLLQTERGERVFQPNLGMNLRRFVFEQITEDTSIEIENDIVDVFETWLPFVELKDIQINTDSINQDQNKININIVFGIKKSPTSLESIEVTLG
jgi:phage baseplate assembly protein W